MHLKTFGLEAFGIMHTKSVVVLKSSCHAMGHPWNISNWLAAYSYLFKPIRSAVLFSSTVCGPCCVIQGPFIRTMERFHVTSLSLINKWRITGRKNGSKKDISYQTTYMNY